MKHTRRPTFNNYISTQPVLASQTSKTSSLPHSPFSLSPSWSWGRPSLLMDPRLEANDFQSNARLWDNRRSGSGLTTSLTGLGIRFTEATPVSESTSNFDEKTESQQIEPSDPLHSANTDATSGHALSVEMPQPDPCVPEPQIFWSTSSSCSVPVYTSDGAIVIASATTDDVNLDYFNLQYPPLEFPSSWSFDSLSAASGCSVDALATQLSAVAAELAQNISSTLPSMWSKNISTNQSSGLGTQEDDATNSYPTFPISSPEMVAPIADINMYDLTLLSQEPCAGINPADIMEVVPVKVKSEPLDSPLLPAHSATSLTPQPPCSPDIRLMLNIVVATDDEPLPPVVVDDPIVKPKHHLSNSKTRVQYYDPEFEYSEDDTQSEYQPTPRLPNLPSPKSPTPTPSPRLTQAKSQTTKESRNQKKTVSNEVASMKVEAGIKREDDLPAIITGTPVLDAHHGIELSELKARAAKYRLRNPGEEIDNTWLLSFAGKLSARGEMLDTYRCYVIGCHQTNKRRDHIVIHIGAHLDRRPFKCQYCPSRFLRKNECKRHELSHTGARPYSCDLCPFEETTFVRQDLLKRHMKRTHGINTTKANKENSEVEDQRPCKRTKRG